MKRVILLSILVFVSLYLHSQKVSTVKAIAFSAVLPGSGHLYLQKNTKAGIYFASEIGIVFSYFRFKSEKEWATNSYKKYAHSMTGLDLNSSESKYQSLQEYYSSSDYNTMVRTYARNMYLVFTNDPESYYEFLDENLKPEEEGWHWQSEDNWHKYKDLRYKKQDYEILTNFAVAAFFLNRFISVIDVAISSRKINKAFRNLSFAPDFKNNGMKMSYGIKF
ncbi:MAG: hypothetical protein K8S23_03255 [Candidatus Cloacimonetes bacterium]|nr:hypothetical protein [Candidatus Cloacimonadota bacterium]